MEPKSPAAIFEQSVKDMAATGAALGLAKVDRAIEERLDRFDRRLDEALASMKSKADVSDTPDPLVSRNKVLTEHFGIAKKASQAAQTVIARLPWIELTPGRFSTRLSAIAALKDELEAETTAKASSKG